MSRYGNLTIATGDPEATYRLKVFAPRTTAVKTWTDVQALDGDYTHQHSVRFDGLMTVDVVIGVQGADKDSYLAALSALRAEAAQLNNVWVHTEPDSSETTIYRVLECALFDEPTGEPTVTTNSGNITLVLVVKPGGEGGPTSLVHLTTKTTPCAISLATLEGVLPGPLALSMQGTTIPGHMHTVIAALAPQALTADKWLMEETEGSPITWNPNLTDEADTDWHGGHAGGALIESYGTWHTELYPEGRYRLWGHVRQSGGIGYISTTIQDPAVVASPAPFTDPVAVTQTTPHLVHIADINLPVSRVSGGHSTLYVHLESDGTNYLYLDYLLVLPLWLGYVSYHPDDSTVECSLLEVSTDGIFVDWVADTSAIQGGVLRPRTTAAMLPNLLDREEPTGATWPATWGRTNTTDVTASGSKFKTQSTADERWAWYAATTGDGPLVVPGEWYDVLVDREVTARVSGSAEVNVWWYYASGVAISATTVSTVSSTGAETSIVGAAKAPPGACFARPRVGVNGNLTAYWRNFVFRRSALQLILVAEQADGAGPTKDVIVNLTHEPHYAGLR